MARTVREGERGRETVAGNHMWATWQLRHLWLLPYSQGGWGKEEEREIVIAPKGTGERYPSHCSFHRHLPFTLALTLGPQETELLGQEIKQGHTT